MSKLKIVIVNGFPESGKDTFIDEALRYLRLGRQLINSNRYSTPPVCIKISAVDQVKKAATILGWAGLKNEEDRQFLSDLKMLSTNYNDGPFRYIVDSVGVFVDIAFIVIREPEEIQKIREYYENLGAEIFVLKIVSNRGKVDLSNTGDSQVNNYHNYTHVYMNYSTLDRWLEQARNFVDEELFPELKGEKWGRFWDKFNRAYAGITKRIP